MKNISCPLLASGVTIQRNWPYGNEEFEERIEISLGRKFEIKKAGRKPKM